MSDTVQVAAFKTIDRNECCEACGGPLYYRTDEHEQVIGKFCGDVSCCRFLRESPDA